MVNILCPFFTPFLSWKPIYLLQHFFAMRNVLPHYGNVVSYQLVQRLFNIGKAELFYLAEHFHLTHLPSAFLCCR